MLSCGSLPVVMVLKIKFSNSHNSNIRPFLLGRVVRKPVNANPGLKVNQRIKFSCLKMLFPAYVLGSVILFVGDSLPYRAPLYPPCASRDFATMCFREFDVRCVMCVGEKFACSVAFYFIDVDVLIRPGDAQKYVSRRPFGLFSFVTLYLFRVLVASFLYFVIFSCTDRRKDV